MTTVLPVIQTVTSPPISIIREHPSVHSTSSSVPLKRSQSSSPDNESSSPDNDVNTPVTKRIRISTVSFDKDSDSVIPKSSDVEDTSSTSVDRTPERTTVSSDVEVRSSTSVDRTPEQTVVSEVTDIPETVTSFLPVCGFQFQIIVNYV